MSSSRKTLILVHRVRFARVIDGLLTQVEHRTYALVTLTMLASLSDTNTPTKSHHMASNYATRLPPVNSVANDFVAGAQRKDRAVIHFVSETPALYKNRTNSRNKSDE